MAQNPIVNPTQPVQPQGQNIDDAIALASGPTSAPAGIPQDQNIDNLINSVEQQVQQSQSQTETKKTEEQPGAFKRAITGYYDMTLGPLVGIGREMYEKNGDIIAQAAADYQEGQYLKAFGKLQALAIPGPDNPEIQTASELFQGAVKGLNDEWGKGIELGRQGRYSEAAGHLLASVIPLIGPAAAHAGERLGGGDIAGGLGETAGLISSTLSPEVRKVPLAGATEKAAEIARAGATKVAETASKVAGKVGLTPEPVDLPSELKKAFPSTNQAPYEEHVPQTVANYLAEHHENVEEIRDTKDVIDALDHSIAENEAKVKDAISKVPDEPIKVNVTEEIQKQLQKIAGPRRLNFVRRGMAAIAKEYDLNNLTISEADSLRRDLNAVNDSVLKANNYKVQDARVGKPLFAAREAAANIMRDAVYNALEEHGLGSEGVTARELRQDEGALTSFRNAVMAKAENGGEIIKGSARPTMPQRLGKLAIEAGGAGAGATLGAGLPVPGSAAAGAGVGALAGKAIAERVVPGAADVSRDAMIERMFGSPETRATGVTERPSELEIGGKIKQPTEAAPKGQQEVPFGPPELFGMSQGERTPMEFKAEELEKIGTFVNKLREKLEDPAATTLEKDAAQRQLEKIFGGKMPEGFKRPKAAGAAKLPAALKNLPAEFEEPKIDRELPKGVDTKAILNHELAHAAVAHWLGEGTFDPHDIISHNHPDMSGKPSRIAAARIEWGNDLVKNPDGTLPIEALKQNLHKMLAINMAGAVANELYDGIKTEENPTLGGDIKDVKEIVRMLGLPQRVVDSFIEWGKNEAANVLKNPDIENLINEYSDTREKGLSDTHHYSVGRIFDFKDRLNAIKGKGNDINVEGNVGERQKYHSDIESIRQGRPATSVLKEATGSRSVERAGSTGAGKVTWPARTTGVHDIAIKEGGAIPGGIQKGDPEIGLKDLVLFHDPQSGSTLALPIDRVTKENVAMELEKSREMYRQAELRKGKA